MTETRPLPETYLCWMTDPHKEVPEPEWLQGLRLAARQRPRTRFVKITWMALQPLLRERDVLWNAASPETRAAVHAMRESENFAYRRPGS